MKLHTPSNSGGILMVTLISSGIMGVALASYLSLVRHQNTSAMRSQYWNQALPVCEAGIEEALMHLANVSTNDRAANGWTLSGDFYTRERWVQSNKFLATISKDPSPKITVSAFVQDPTGKSPTNVARTVAVTTTNDALFAKGMVARGIIDLRGNNLRTDSFDSTDPTGSTDGKYDLAKARDRGDVATNSGLVNSLAVGNADIYGRASTGPGGTISVGPNGGVGSKSWLDGGNNGIQSGWSSDDMNVAFPEVKVPFTGGASSPTSGVVNGVNYKYVLNGGNFDMLSLTMNGSQELIVTQPSILYVRGDISLSGNARIIIAAGATLRLYCGGADASINGKGVANQNASASAFSYFGLPTNTSLSLGGNASFTGAIYAPSAEFHLGGGGSDSYDFAGASVTASVKMNGHFKFHYDEALGKFGPRRGYVVTSWNEM